MVEVAGGNNEEVGKRKKKNLLDLHTNSNLPYFIVNKERFDQNKIHKIPKPQVDIYSKKQLYSKYSDRSTCLLIADPV